VSAQNMRPRRLLTIVLSVARILDNDCQFDDSDHFGGSWRNTHTAFFGSQEHHWPKGGEIDILEGANALPVVNSTAWTATTNLKAPTLNTLPPNADTSCVHNS
jgi:hypothetical protein